MKAIELTEEQVKMIVHALETNIRVNKDSIRMYEICGKNEHTRETVLNIVEDNMCLRTLLNYIEQV